MTAPCGCLLRGQRGDTAGPGGRERPRNSGTSEVQSGYGYPLPVIAHAGLAGIVDITDVCRELLDPRVSGTPETMARRSA